MPAAPRRPPRGSSWDAGSPGPGEPRARPGGAGVADTGEGIRERDRERVFEPFWRGEPSRTGPGSGLGLALAKRIVESLGGDIRVESAPSAGSRFAVLLPTT